MEGISKYLRSRTVRVIAVLAAVGLGLIGVAGSGSAKSSSPTSPPVVAKVAGATKDVSFAVSNRGVHPALTVDLCSNPANWTGDDPCSGNWGISGQKHIRPGESFRFTYGTVGGRVRLPDGKYVYFLADNLAFRRPAITLYAPTDRVPLVEGEIQIRHRHGHKIELLREADTQYKNMAIGIFPR